MIQRASRLAGEFLNVEVECWSEGEQAWVPGGVDEMVRVEGGATRAAVAAVDARFGDKWGWVPDGCGCLRVTVRRAFDKSVRLRREVDLYDAS